MLVSDFENNPKRIALLLAAYEAMGSVAEYFDDFDEKDYEYNEREYTIAETKLSLEMDYPNESWSKLEFAIDNDDSEFKTVESIPWGTKGVLYVYDSTGKYSEWWI